MEKTVKQFFETSTDSKVESILTLPQSGSSRSNFILESNGKKFVITHNENLAENNAFFYFSTIFSGLNLNSPSILAISEDGKMYLQDFVGDQTLSEIITENGTNEKVKSLVKQTLQKLFQLQIATENKVDYSQTFEYEEYNRFPIQNDLFYFKNMFIDVLELPYHKLSLLQDFENLVKSVEGLQPKTLMIRDFQARNIMVNSTDEVHFIDYQSAMKGPAMYDVISFLFQAKANFSAEFKNEMLEFYINLWQDEQSKKNLQNSIYLLQLVRYLQVLGAYGFRGLIQKKKHFLESIPKGVKNIVEFAENWEKMKSYPELQKLILSLKLDEVKLNLKG